MVTEEQCEATLISQGQEGQRCPLDKIPGDPFFCWTHAKAAQWRGISKVLRGDLEPYGEAVSDDMARAKSRKALR